MYSCPPICQFAGLAACLGDARPGDRPVGRAGSSGCVMSNRKDRRKAAAIRRSAKPMSKTERSQLVSRVVITVAAVAAAMVLLSLAFRGGF